VSVRDVLEQGDGASTDQISAIVARIATAGRTAWPALVLRTSPVRAETELH